MNRCVVGVSPGIAGMGQDDGANSVDHLGLNSLEPPHVLSKEVHGTHRRFQRRALGAVSSEIKKIGRCSGRAKYR